MAHFHIWLFDFRLGPLDITALAQMQVGFINRIIVKFAPYISHYYVATIFTSKTSRDFDRTDVPFDFDLLLFGEDQIQPPEVTRNKSTSTLDDELS